MIDVVDIHDMMEAADMIDTADTTDMKFNPNTSFFKDAVYEFNKFVCENNCESIMNCLNNYGVAIVPNVLDNAECEQMISGMWDYLEHISQNWKHHRPIRRDDPMSWNGINLLNLIHNMLFKNYNIGHAQFIWDLRQNKKILDIFSGLLDEDAHNLLSSFDGASFHIPSINKNKKPTEWFHVDQSFLNSDFQCIQSWVTAYDVNEGDATLSVLTGSHKYHSQCRKIFKIKNPKNWYKLKSEEIDFYLNQGCEQIFIKCPKGSLVLWDSRTVHYGSGPFPNRAIESKRLVAYLCYLPRIGISNKQLANKQNAFVNLTTTTHWPDIIEEVPDRPEHSKAVSIKKINPPKLSKIGWRLAGFDDAPI